MTRFLLLLLLLTGAARAQEPQQPQQRPRTMVDFRDELKLSKQQVTDIVTALKRFQDDGTTGRLKLMAAECETAALIQRHADLVDIKDSLKQLTDLRYDLRVLDVETSRKVESILSPDQYAKWQAIQVRERSKSK